MTSRAERLSVVAMALGLVLSAPAQAAPLGNRPLGSDGESARTVGVGRWLVEVGAWQPRLDGSVGPSNEEEQGILGRLEAIPAWPSLRVQHGLPDGNEALVRLGQNVQAGYRRQFLRADAPWGGEYLQALMQASVGYGLISRRPLVHVLAPCIYEAGPFTLHVAGGGYYMFNDQPIVEGSGGIELRPWDWVSIGAHSHLRMDSKKMTPTDGSWSYGGGLRLQPSDGFSVQVEMGQDVGPPEPAGGTPAKPRIEWPMQVLRASAIVAF
ncbi:MAG: hypothetical protein VKS61_07865 [Candidatus Sericytochromatia bacterium]|nr:hypothetical protein [Candidatus Sericytochromatia bacterium]